MIKADGNKVMIAGTGEDLVNDLYQIVNTLLTDGEMPRMIARHAISDAFKDAKKGTTKNRNELSWLPDDDDDDVEVLALDKDELRTLIEELAERLQSEDEENGKRS